MNLDTLENVLLALLVADAIALAVLVLIQQGKGADVGAAFGSGSANTMFGSGGSTSFLAKLTSWLAVGFFAISFGLAYTAKERAGSLSELGIPQIVSPGIEQTSDALESDPAPGDVPDLGSDIPSVDSLDSLLEDGDIPQLTGDDVSVGELISEELTGEGESVDSDIPDL